jgi:hypothetical protein
MEGLSSLAQLEKQIELATVAMARASEGKGLKTDVKEELGNFSRVLQQSKARLKELEQIKRQCDELSVMRDERGKHKTSPIKMVRLRK